MNDVESASLTFSFLVIVVAGLLGLKEWRDRRTRDPDLSPEDARHFRYQDSRRWLGIVVMCLLAAGLVVGSRLPPRVGNRANPQFLGLWLGVFLLILFLLFLALIDWIALQVYARRQRGVILQERIEIFKKEARRLQTLDDDGDEPDDENWRNN